MFTLKTLVVSLITQKGRPWRLVGHPIKGFNEVNLVSKWFQMKVMQTCLSTTFRPASYKRICTYQWMSLHDKMSFSKMKQKQNCSVQGYLWMKVPLGFLTIALAMRGPNLSNLYTVISWGPLGRQGGKLAGHLTQTNVKTFWYAFLLQIQIIWIKAVILIFLQTTELKTNLKKKGDPLNSPFLKFCHLSPKLSPFNPFLLNCSSHSPNSSLQPSRLSYQELPSISEHFRCPSTSSSISAYRNFGKG